VEQCPFPTEGGTAVLPASAPLSGRDAAFNPNRFMPFGAKVIVQEPKGQRQGPKELPSQRKARGICGLVDPLGTGSLLYLLIL
jgi:hypothetical protein